MHILKSQIFSSMISSKRLVVELIAGPCSVLSEFFYVICVRSDIDLFARGHPAVSGPF